MSRGTRQSAASQNISTTEHVIFLFVSTPRAYHRRHPVVEGHIHQNDACERSRAGAVEIGSVWGACSMERTHVGGLLSAAPPRAGR